ncbi:MAG: hypothetical protein VB111_11195 [Clostridiaceae bacterium]|nr:hypothetical protein [Clostridiaceae bacterium]
MNICEKLLREGGGILRLAPAWVPRSFCRPAKRIKLHPDDYYKLGLARGGIDERWLASATPADNGPGTPADEGLSYAVSRDGRERVTLAEMVDTLKGELIGQVLWDKYQRWPAFSKFFDNLGPLPHHIHHDEAHAARVGMHKKPEMYFFPAQMNAFGGEFPFTFFGLRPETTKEELYRALAAFPKGDNRILELSVAYKLALDTGWNVPPGVLHAPGSLCTYEPQFASDVFAMYQSMLYFEHAVPEELLWKNCPPEKMGDVDYLMEVVDWEKNIDPYFSKNSFMRPVIDTKTDAYADEWICYRCKLASAKRLTVSPGQSVRLTDAAAHGIIAIEGCGTINGQPLESPTLIRFGALTNDEYFIPEPAAKDGVIYENHSASEPLVILRHFAENPACPAM